MVATFRAAMTAVPAATNATISQGRGGNVSLTAADVGDPPTMVFVVGKVVSGPPAAYSDFTVKRHFAIFGAGVTASIKYNADLSVITVTVSKFIDAGIFTDGDELWAAWFETGPDEPSADDVPAATAGPFLATA